MRMLRSLIQFVDELTINPASWVIYHLFDLKLVFWHDSLLFIYVLCIKGGDNKSNKMFQIKSLTWMDLKVII